MRERRSTERPICRRGRPPILPAVLAALWLSVLPLSAAEKKIIYDGEADPTPGPAVGAAFGRFAITFRLEL